MRHVRDATHSYARRTTTHHDMAPAATLALRLNRLATPTLLSPSQTRRHTGYEDNGELSSVFQSNGFLESPSRYFLAGLGIHYELDSSDILQFSENNHSSGTYDGGCYIQDVKNASAPAGTVFRPRDHATKYFTCASDSHGSFGIISDTSLPDLVYPSFSSSASLASIQSASDNEAAQPPPAFSLPFHVEDDVLACPLTSIGLIPDINMYNLTLLAKEPSVGVDPLDTMGRVTRSPRTVLSSSEVPLPSHFSAANYGSPPYNSSSDPITHGEVGESTPPPSSQYCPSLDIIPDITTIPSTFDTEVPDETFMTYVRSRQSSLEQCAPPQGTRVSPIIKMESDDLVLHVSSPNTEERCLTRKNDMFSFPSDGAFPSRQIRTERNDLAQVEPYPSPVLNAHVGVELSELTFRAQRYRARHPGQGIDRAWLMNFAGKLTNCGELIDDYRCYVVGCSQRNKRRDHIIIHVGGHVDQRAFSCAMWFVLFLLLWMTLIDGWQPTTVSPQE